MKMKSNQKNQ